LKNTLILILTALMLSACSGTGKSNFPDSDDTTDNDEYTAPDNDLSEDPDDLPDDPSDDLSDGVLTESDDEYTDDISDDISDDIFPDYDTESDYDTEQDDETAPDDDTCSESDLGQEPCGINGNGIQKLICLDGKWELLDDCEDDDICLNGSTINTPYSCGTDNDGYQPLICSDGDWVHDGDCVEIPCPDYLNLSELPDRDIPSIAAFNMLRLGHNNNKDFRALACIIKNFSITGIVELMNETGVTTLKNELELVTGEKWDYHISDYAAGRTTYKEYYGYIWRTDKVKLLSVHGFYPELDDEFEREPFGAEFVLDDFVFTLVLSHIIYGDTVAQRRAEILELKAVYNYFQSLDPLENDIILAGDFNHPYDPAYFTLTTVDSIINTVSPATLTTIGDSGLSSSYDNIFYSQIYSSEIASSGVLDYTMNNYSDLNKTVSDHLPVYVLVTPLVTP